jgi:hypothetical protein
MQFAHRLPRLLGTLAMAIALSVLVYLVAPHQLPVTLYKISLIATAAVAGYWLDRALFPYARPDGYLAEPLPDRYAKGQNSIDGADYQVNDGYELVFAGAILRRAIIVGCAMLAVGLGA